MTITNLILITISVIGLCIGIYSSSLFDIRVFKTARVRDDEVMRLVLQVGFGMLICSSAIGLSIGLSSAKAMPHSLYEQVLITFGVTSLCAISGTLLTTLFIVVQLLFRSRLKQRLSDTEPNPQFKEAMDKIETQTKSLPKDLWNMLLWRLRRK